MLINPALYTLAAELGEQLAQREVQVTTAESCTGGAVAGAITAVAGSSAWFDGGFVTYSNSAKERLLNVPAELIRDHGVVSEPVARAMVAGACGVMEADYGLAISGIAGPSGGSSAKPVGRVCIAWGSPTHIIARTFQFDGDRDAVREASVVSALEALLSHLKSTV